MPAVLLALDAEIHLKGPRGWRMVKASDFFQDLFRVDMRADEIIASVQFVPVRAAAYAKLHQRASHYAIVGVAASLEVSGGTIVSARVGVTGATSHATRLSNVERALAGQPLSSATIDRAAQMAAAELGDVNADMHASADYRRAMVQVFARRSLVGRDGSGVGAADLDCRHEEAVEHHLRDAADQALAQARDRAARLHRAGDVHDGRRAVGAQRDGRAPLHEPRPPLALGGQAVRRRAAPGPTA